MLAESIFRSCYVVTVTSTDYYSVYSVYQLASKTSGEPSNQ